MTKQHAIDYYLDGHVSVAYCKRCSAEGDKLLEDCPQVLFKPANPDKINEDFLNYSLDEKKQTAK